MNDVGNLLQMIYDLLTGWYNSFTSHAVAVMEKLNLIEEDTASIKISASDIKSNTDDIKDNTGAIITPVQSIKTNTDSIKTDTTSIKNNVSTMTNQLGTISTNVGTASAYTEDVANNTLDIKDRIVTIGSDTTQLRSNSNTITSDVADIKTALNYYLSSTPVTEDVEGAICNIDTDLTDYLQLCKVTIPADQTGYTGITLTKTGKNLINFDSVLPNGWSRTNSGITAEYNNGIMHVYGTNELNTWNNIVTFNEIWRNNELRLPSGTFAIPDHLAVRISEDNTNYGNKGGVVTYNNPIYIRGFYVSVPANYTIDWYIPMVFIYGSTIPTTYEPYKAMTYPVSFGSTITDGAEIDLLEGLIKINSTPVSYQSITPVAVRTYKGVNNIFSDVGTTALTYRETLKHYIDKQEA